MDDADRDLLIVAMTAFDEASNQGHDGIRAQIHSVINRHRAGKWYSRKTLAGTCLAPFAYSAMNTADPNRERGAETSLEDPIYQLCLAEAAMAIAGTTEDPTGGATHYYAAGTPEPLWVSGKDPKTGAQIAPPAEYTVRIKDHLFFKDVT